MHILIDKSQTLINQKKYDEAIEILKPLLNTEHKVDALYQCGKIMMHAGKEKEAWVYFKELIGINSEMKDKINFWIAKFKYYHGEQAKADEMILTLIQENSNNLYQVYLDYAEMKKEEGNLQEAERILEEAASKFSDSPVILGRLANIKMKLDKKEETLQHLKQMLVSSNIYRRNLVSNIVKLESELYPDKGETEYTRLLAKLKKSGKEVPYYEAYEEGTISDQQAQVLLAKADSLLQMQAYDKANVYYRRLVNIKSCTERCIYGVVIASIRSKKLASLEQFVIENKKNMSVTLFDRINEYLNMKFNIGKTDDDVIESIASTHGEHFYDNISTIYKTIMENADSNKLVTGNTFTYVVEFDRIIGIDFNGVETKKIKVVAFLDETNIVTMYPIVEFDESTYTIKINSNAKAKK